ncbi:hypothetical protein E2562_030114 [Oryza meyeriana var. granulata]|uniref:Uncharacterized protein n=1 Tax=Oryza meyeriana var. granulata TaxID=110450 RepID=A0A6G1BNN6_9ORYZ|nr:hypothetical protein E2562_030114 [Oryza meyeriana var. granulata]
MKSEASHKQGAAAGTKVTVLQSPMGLRSILSSLVAFFVVVSTVSLLVDRGQEGQVQLAVEQHQHQEVQLKKPAAAIVDEQKSVDQSSLRSQGQEAHAQWPSELLDDGDGDGEECNWSLGRWVYDDASRPLYSGLKCSFIFDEVACDKYGRNDTMYQHWRWQPHGCNLPRFNATKLLEKLRNKRLVFVGDSVNRNQWVSMVCMVEASIPDGRKMRVYNGSLISFKAFEYNATIDFYWSPLLLESNSDNPIIHRVEYRIIRADRIEKHASIWRDADVIVFNSYLWWRKQKADMMMKVMYGSFEDGDAKLDEVEMVDGFEIALKKLTEWLGTNINKNKTRIFFAGSSPAHSWASDWGGDDNKKCLNETEPIQREGYKGATTDYSMMDKAKEIFGALEPKGIHVQILNITQLSDYRKDAHPTIFRRQFVPLTKEQIANPSGYADCTHWCLPGVPDVWNEFLYAYLVHK